MRKLYRNTLIALSLWPVALSAAGIAQGIRDYQFYDADDHWAAICIQGIGADGLMKGYLDESFRPEGTLTRAEFAAVMGKAFPNAPKIREAVNFSDVASDFWGKAAIAYAYERGFLTGYPDNVFQPNQAISRAQAVIVIAKTQNLLPVVNATAALDIFVDASQIPDYAEGDVAASTQQGLVVSYPNRNQLRPNDSITRGEAAALLCKVSEGSAAARYYVPSEYVAGTSTPPRLSPLAVRSETVQILSGGNATLGDRLFFWGHQNDVAALWETDGTKAGTQPVSALKREQAGRTILAQTLEVGRIDAVGDRLWLEARPRSIEGSPAYDLLGTLWSSDGTDAGTRAIATLHPELPQILEAADTWLSASENKALTPAGKLPFAISGPTEAQLWQTDGTTAGTERLVTFPYAKNDNGWPMRFWPRNFILLDNDDMIFTANSDDGKQGLWRTDGTPEGTTLFKTFEEITVVSRSFTPAQGRAYFTVGTPESGDELWVTEGTEESTVLLNDIYPGEVSSGSKILTNIRETYFFLANSDQGMELWSTEGTPESTRLIKRLSPDVIYDGNITYAIHDGKLFFAAPTIEQDDPDGGTRISHNFDLWVSDGTEMGTQRLGLALNNNVADFTSYKGRLFFSGYGPQNGQELWVSDGSVEGTYQVTDLAPGGERYQSSTSRFVPYGSAPRSLTVLGDYLYFLTNDDELFRTDGTASGLQKIDSGDDRDSFVQAEITKLGDRLLLTGYNERSRQAQLWVFSE